MSINIGKYLDGYYNWGLSHNQFHKSNIFAYEFIDIQLNSTDNNAPPTVKLNTAFHIWKEAVVSVSTNSIGNNCFPATTTVNDWQAEAVFEPADRVLTWTSSLVSSTGTDGNYWLYCSGAEDLTSTSIGLGVYGVASSFTFTFASSYGNIPYSTQGYRGLASFTMSTNILSNLVIYNKSFRNTIKEVSTDYTATIFDSIIIAKTASITLPAVIGASGLILNIKRNSTNTVIIYGQIDGSTSKTINSNYDNYSLIAGSTAWYIL